jgi:acylpyruvate hydrolase
MQPDGSTRLYAATSDGALYDVVDAARLDREVLVGVDDVGSLLRAGSAAMDAVRRVIAEAEGSTPAALRRDDLDMAPPVTEPRAIVCIGRNYMAHITEGDSPVPAFPILFSKYLNTLLGHDHPVVHHAITQQLDYEGELAVVIGRRARRVSADQAMGYVAGYTVANDISARDLQLGDLQWIRGKSLDGFCPLGPFFVTSDEVPDVDGLRIQTRVNGELRQDAPVSDMIFKLPELIEFITQGITLEPGDLVLTGTPSGVAFGMRPPVYLRPGDVVEVSITGLGTLRSPIGAPD